MKPYIIGFYGKSNTGKTTIITDLIKRLTEDDFKVATIKKSDKEISIDEPGKDTYRHAESGAKLTVLSSKFETDFVVKKNIKTNEIVGIISQIGSYDFIFVEGAFDKYVPKIRIGDIDKRENTVFDYDGDFGKLYNLVKSKGIKGENKK